MIIEDLATLLYDITTCIFFCRLNIVIYTENEIKKLFSYWKMDF